MKAVELVELAESQAVVDREVATAQACALLSPVSREQKAHRVRKSLEEEELLVLARTLLTTTSLGF